MIFRRPLSSSRSAYLGLLGIAIVGVAILYSWNPVRYTFYPKCWFLWTTGLFCPGCGFQRALHYLLRGDVLLALRHNLFMFFALPILGTAFLRWTQEIWFARPPRGRQARPGLLKVLLILTVSFWLLRNIPVYPLTLLAPPPLPLPL